MVEVSSPGKPSTDRSTLHLKHLSMFMVSATGRLLLMGFYTESPDSLKKTDRLTDALDAFCLE